MQEEVQESGCVLRLLAAVCLDNPLYAGAVAYYEEWSKLQTLYDDVYNDAYIDSSTVDCWYRGFALWMNNNTDPNNAPLLSSTLPHSGRLLIL